MPSTDIKCLMRTLTSRTHVAQKVKEKNLALSVGELK